MRDPKESRAAEYRRLAEQNRKIARQISLKDAREPLIEAAKRLEALAEEEERRAPDVRWRRGEA